MSLKVASICGALRKDSFNRKLMAIANAELSRLGCEVDVIDLKTLALPIYDGDVEAAGIPAPVAELKQRLDRAQAMLFVSPEYNFSIPGGLKNAIDWASRPPGPKVFASKAAAIMGASGGMGATLRMQPHLRDCLGGLGMLVLGGFVALPAAHTLFDGEGQLKNEQLVGQVKALCNQLVALGSANPLLQATK